MGVGGFHLWTDSVLDSIDFNRCIIGFFNFSLFGYNLYLSLFGCSLYLRLFGCSLYLSLISSNFCIFDCVGFNYCGTGRIVLITYLLSCLLRSLPPIWPPLRVLEAVAVFPVDVEVDNLVVELISSLGKNTCAGLMGDNISVPTAVGDRGHLNASKGDSSSVNVGADDIVSDLVSNTPESVLAEFDLAGMLTGVCRNLSLGRRLLLEPESVAVVLAGVRRLSAIARADECRKLSSGSPFKPESVAGGCRPHRCMHTGRCRSGWCLQTGAQDTVQWQSALSQSLGWRMLTSHVHADGQMSPWLVPADWCARYCPTVSCCPWGMASLLSRLSLTWSRSASSYR